METVKPKSKFKVTVHESAVEEGEITKFLKGITNTEFSFVSELSFTTENLVSVNSRFGTQIDDIKAKLRMAGIIPGLQDVVIYGSSFVLQGLAYSKKYPDTRVLLIPVQNDTVRELPNEGNIRGINWQLLQAYLADKTGSRIKTTKAEKDKLRETKHKRENIERTPSKSRPTEVEERPESNEPSSDEDFIQEEDDPRYS